MHQAGVEGVHARFKVICPPTIAQPFMAGNKAIKIPSPVRDGRIFLSSLTGLGTSRTVNPAINGWAIFKDVGFSFT
jgi:hypothetical protein